MGPGARFRRGFLLACGAFHACAWQVAHAVGRGHGGEYYAAAGGGVLTLSYALTGFE